VTDARCIFVAGMRGGGKSTKVQSLIAGASRVVCFDPTGQYSRPARARGYAWPRASSLAELHTFAASHWGYSTWRVALTVAGDYPAELHKLSTYLWHAMQPYESGRDRKKLVLVVEEMDLGAPNQKLPKGMGGFQQLTLQGRHRGIEIIGVTQHAAMVPLWFRINCPDRYLFPLGIEDQGILGARHRAAIERLRPHEFLHFGEGGTVTAGKNPPPRRR
jgi:hypothetical protein